MTNTTDIETKIFKAMEAAWRARQMGAAAMQEALCDHIVYLGHDLIAALGHAEAMKRMNAMRIDSNVSARAAA